MNDAVLTLAHSNDAAGLRVANLRKSYKKKIVIRDVSLRLDQGEVVALLGPNGSGKTTTFYAIAGLVYPEGGHIYIDGREVSTLPMYRRARLGIGYLPQEMSIFRGLSVEDNILAILDIAEPDRARRRERLEQLLSLNEHPNKLQHNKHINNHFPNQYLRYFYRVSIRFPCIRLP